LVDARPSGVQASKANALADRAMVATHELEMQFDVMLPHLEYGSITSYT
jgi:hypothetical protein